MEYVICVWYCLTPLSTAFRFLGVVCGRRVAFVNGESQARSYSGGGDSVSSGGCSSGSSKSLYGLEGIIGLTGGRRGRTDGLSSPNLYKK